MNLFAYGTLMCADIMRHVAGCLPSAMPVTLKHYRRCRVTGEEYPAIVRQEGFSVQGVLYLDVPEEAWIRLDRFEGEMYERKTVRTECEETTGMIAETYVMNPEFTSLLLLSDWTYEQFLVTGKKRFEADYRGFEALPLKGTSGK